MGNIGEAFALASINDLHSSRTADIGRILWGTGFAYPGGTATENLGHDYAVAHHLLEGAEKAARGADQTTFAWYRAGTLSGDSRWRSEPNGASRIVLRPHISTLEQSSISETPYTVLSPSTRAAEPQHQQLVHDAVDIAARTGFGHLTNQHGSIVCLLRHRSVEQTLDSWTISRLPGTVFVDYTNAPTVLARDLIHEAGHNWLNDAFAASATTFDPAATFYSPWKATMRPAFGFLHACWSFPLMLLFISKIIDTEPAETRRYFHAYLRQQRTFLHSTQTDFPRALKLVRDNDLRERVADVYTAALTA